MPVANIDTEFILKRTNRLWNDAVGKNFFLTGGTGFFGKWLIESFAHINDKLNLGSQMLVLSRNPESFLKQNPYYSNLPSVSFMRGDFKDFTFPEEQFDYVMHVANDTQLQIGSADPDFIVETITTGTRHMLDFAEHCGAKRFLFTSTGAVYNRNGADKPCISEEDFDPDNPPDLPYARGKIISEQMCLEHCRNRELETVIARCFAFIGPYMDLGIYYAAGNFINDALNGRTIRINGDGKPYRSYMYMADLVVWLWTMLFAAETGTVYNVGSDQPVTIAELAEKVSNCVQPSCRVEILNKNVTAQAASRYVPSTNKAMADLGLSCDVDIEEAINRTIRYYRTLEII